MRSLAGIAESLNGVIADVPASRVRFGNHGPENAGTKVVKPWPNDVSQITKKKVRSAQQAVCTPAAMVLAIRKHAHIIVGV